MKNLITILIPLFIINFLFSIGLREERELYNINSKLSFSDIMGWNRFEGEWKKNKNKVYHQNKTEEERIQLDRFTYYEIIQLPNILVLIIEGRNSYFFLIEKEELNKKLQFKQNQFDQIKIKLINKIKFIDYTDDYSLDSIEKIESEVFHSIYQKENNFSNNDDFLVINYYKYDDVIQYLLSFENCFLMFEKEVCNDKGIVGGIPLLGKVGDVKDMKDKYFESPVNKFESFFKSPLE